jgi:hypothetical protein
MKFLAVALITTLVSAEAFSQTRPGRRNPGRNPAPRHEPGPGRYNPIPAPGRYNPAPSRGPVYSCYYSDMYKNNRRLVHRFNYSQECKLALQNVVRSGRFCDGNDMFDMNGRFLNSYRNTILCQARIQF